MFFFYLVLDYTVYTTITSDYTLNNCIASKVAVTSSGGAIATARRS